MPYRGLSQSCEQKNVTATSTSTAPMPLHPWQPSATKSRNCTQWGEGVRERCVGAGQREMSEQHSKSCRMSRKHRRSTGTKTAGCGLRIGRIMGAARVGIFNPRRARIGTSIECRSAELLRQPFSSSSTGNQRESSIYPFTEWISDLVVQYMTRFVIDSPVPWTCIELFSLCLFAEDAVHITAILGEGVVFNCHVEFPNDHPVPYVLQWDKKVSETVRYHR